jgi:hypothetical protein
MDAISQRKLMAMLHCLMAGLSYTFRDRLVSTRSGITARIAGRMCHRFLKSTHDSVQ